MNTDPRRLAVPEPIASDRAAFEVVSAWFAGGKVTAMTATGSGLEHNPEVMGQILAAIAQNAALSAKAVAGADYSAYLTKMLAAFDERVRTVGATQATHYSR
jgi:hypothetical protein